MRALILLAALGTWVDPMIGTEATGHAFPVPCRPFGLCGNDDCGQMSAWYLQSVLEGGMNHD